MSKAIFEDKFIHDIKGDFFVPAYQRGYRWDIEVERLLNDIQEAMDLKEKTYWLQPIVVKKIDENKYELIDGQQRLTTIFLIYKVISLQFPTAKANFVLDYETRPNSKQFLETINDASEENFIDFFYMKRAYKRIKDWFSKQKDFLQSSMKFYNSFNEFVKVLWYEVDESENSNKLFQRLNIGKIPLTSAELVKALFLNKVKLDSERQQEIALQWDNIEKELHNDSLWFFLTNSSKSEYQPKIELILDLISGKKVDEKDDYFTFFYFDKAKKEKELLDIWSEIQRTFLILKDWYHEHDLYHKIGYLISSNFKSLQEIYNASIDKKKTEFVNLLDSFIKQSVSNDKNYGELTYQNNSDQKKIHKLLLLFNVESTRQHGEESQWFPFDKYKCNKWSLEHIHAQQSEGMKDVAAWKEWLKLHQEAINDVGQFQIQRGRITAKELDDINNQISEMIAENHPTNHYGDKFNVIREKVEGILSENLSVDFLHSISNLALLNTRDNAALNNSTFDVKRNQIISMIKKGNFIPYCTQMVFLKYYTPSSVNQVHFWGQTDRESYIKEINKVLQGYLKEEIVLTKEDD